jgi:hypothetical protein
MLIWFFSFTSYIFTNFNLLNTVDYSVPFAPKPIKPARAALAKRDAELGSGHIY